MKPAAGQIWRWLGSACEPDEMFVFLLYEMAQQKWIWVDVDTGVVTIGFLTLDVAPECWKRVI